MFHAFVLDRLGDFLWEPDLWALRAALPHRSSERGAPLLTFRHVRHIIITRERIALLERPLDRILTLECRCRWLTSRPLLPSGQRLVCSSNKLVELPPLPECVELNCSNNDIVALPELPKCRKLNCNYNRILTLPPLPVCVELSCIGNRVRQLPRCGPLVYLACSGNFLTDLSPVSLDACKTLMCSSNQLTELPPLPVCEKLVCYSNLFSR
jgi:Leucine-rich repeat (LRR) protein